MKTQEIIEQLKTSSLIAQCPKCGNKFGFSKAILFDGTKKKEFPPEALEIKERLEKDCEEAGQELNHKIELATTRAGKTTEAVNIGKGLEKIVPTFKDFKWMLPDSRFLFDPIDLVIFNGLSSGKVDSISFIEVKTGQSSLNPHQKMVKRAIGEKKISYREIYD